MFREAYLSPGADTLQARGRIFANNPALPGGPDYPAWEVHFWLFFFLRLFHASPWSVSSPAGSSGDGSNLMTHKVLE